MAETIDISKIIDEASIRAIQLRVLAIGILVGVVDGFDNQALAFTAPAISRQWGLSPGSMAPAFAGGLAGMMFGSMLFGEIADRRGRRFVFVVATTLFGVVTVATVYAESLAQLVALRFVGGLGIGGLPSVMASLVSEYAPRRYRATFGNWAFLGIPLGGFVGGLVAAQLIPRFGWEAIYWTGGAITLTVAAGAYPFLPESILFELSTRRAFDRVRTLLGQVAPGAPLPADAVLVSGRTAPVRTSIVSVFGDGRGRMTALFWIAEVILLMGYYFLVNWTPVLLTSSGLPIETAVLGSVFLNVGGIVFGLVLGWLCDRLGARRVMSTTFVVGALSLLLAVQFAGSVPLRMGAIFLAGGAWIAGQAAIVVVIAASYPPEIRGIATGWALAAGRIGAIVSPAVVSIPLGLGWQVGQILLLPVVPALIGAVCIYFARPSRTEPGGPGGAVLVAEVGR